MSINNEQNFTCAHCGQTFDGFGIETDSGTYCEDCAHDCLVWCEHCETWHDEDECEEVRVYRYLAGYSVEMWCCSCVYDDATRCYDCDTLVDTGSVQEVRGGFDVCPRCLEESYRYCDECGTFVHNTQYDDDEELCIDCIGANLIAGYHRANADFPRFFAEGENAMLDGLCFIGEGREIEIDRRNVDPMAERKCVTELHALLGERAVFERDGSLHRGFEIVTRPHTMRAWAEDFPLDEVLNICKKHGYLAHDIGTCGYHLHISRRYFGASTAAQERAIGKCIAFYDCFYNDIVNASRRDRDRAAQWAARVPVDDIKDARKKAKWENKSHSDRYAAVNTTNEHTVEFRIMRGTLNADTFRACDDFLHAIARNSKRLPWDIATTDPAEMLKGIAPDTRDYLRKRGAFTAYLDNIQTADGGAVAQEVK